MTQFKITDIRAREIIDGRGTPTVEIDIWVDNFHVNRAIAPAVIGHDVTQLARAS